jgi:mannan polymerase II complex MNN11 subunit
VLILALDPATDLTHLERIIANRRQYAKARGYGVFSMSVDQFKHIYEDSVSHSSRWAMLPVCREAMHAFPNAKYFWYLDQDALILDMSLDIEKDIMAPRKLGPMMLRGIPVVRRLPYVHTYKNNDPKMVEFVFTQDEIGMNSRSFIFKNGDSAKALVDLWQDASFRHHDGFDRSDIDALNHLIQWHPFYLGRTAVIPTRKLAAVPDVTSEHMSAEVATSLQYKDGDAVIVIECQQNVRGCSPFFEPFWKLVEEKTATDQIQSPSTISVHPRFVRSVK